MVDKSKSGALDQDVMAVLYPTYENVKKALRDISRDPDTLSEDAIEDFMDRLKLPGAKYAFMSMPLARDYSISNTDSDVKQD